MEAVNNLAMTQQDGSTNKSLTLEQAQERLVQLLREAEANAWEIGDLLNQVENQGLARREGFGKTKTWLEKKVPEVAGKTTTLYRYAAVAAVYTKEHVEAWGISKLELLIAHDRAVLGHTSSENPANRELQLLQPDGSTIIKKFHDCNWRELQESTRDQRQGRKAPGKKSPGAREAKLRSLSKASSRTADHGNPATEERSLRLAFAMIAAGLVICVVSQVLPLGVFAFWLALPGVVCFFGGLGIVVRHWHDFRDRLVLAIKEGRALQFLKERFDHASRGAARVATAIRSKVKATNTTTKSPEGTPPPEKKAA